ncbi:hypothetical protein D3218_03255 [Aureimonas flava]|uniref:Uncharacterized protein n=1 Tax=Aureimonas flava TaxID=2320271 RepID=A0A3A1WPE9_9HYPH|nr:hypothetical protein [Aureimonas flava]RIY03767.1 hypothetical protein D3218_03255 [Aureimonas flava]
MAGKGKPKAQAKPTKAGRRVPIKTFHIEAIVSAVKASDMAPTWEDIRDIGERAFGHCWTRQALERHDAIKEAYLARQSKSGASKSAPSKDPAIDLLEQRIALQAAELERLRMTIGELNDLFVRYQYNAHARGISPAELEASLPIVPKRRSHG